MFTKPRHDSSKGNTRGGGRVELTKNVSTVDALVTSEQTAEPRLTLMEDPRNLNPKGKGVGRYEEEEQETSQNVPLGTIDLGSFEVLSDHGDAVEDDVDLDECSEEATGMMPPLPPASWFKKTGTSKHTETYAGDFGNIAMGIAETKSLHSSIVGIGSMSSLTFCSKWIFGHETLRSLYPV